MLSSDSQAKSYHNTEKLYPHSSPFTVLPSGATECGSWQFGFNRAAHYAKGRELVKIQRRIKDLLSCHCDDTVS